MPITQPWTRLQKGGGCLQTTGGQGHRGQQELWLQDNGGISVGDWDRDHLLRHLSQLGMER